MQCDRRQFVVGATALGSSIVWNFGGAGAAFAQAKSVSATFGPTGILYAATMVAVERGFAKEEGLDVKLVVTDGGAKSRQVLAAGQTDFAHGDAVHPMQIGNRGKPAKMLLATETYASYSNIVIRKDLYDQGITTPAKLAEWKRPNGAKPIVAATAVGSGTWMFGTYVFDKLGVGDSINWIGGGGAQTMLGGLGSKQFDAIMALPAWQIEAEKRGWGAVIYDVTDRDAWNRTFGGPLPVSVVYALDTTIAAHEAETQAYVNALYRSIQWLKAASVDDIYVAIGQKYIGELDPDVVKQEIGFYKKLWNYSGAVTEEEFKRGGQVWYREGTDIKETTYKDAVEPRFLANAQRKFG
ncbi:MAG TPA: ABC transporter substrate-binding protein [Stellaceae bacterium]